MDTTQTLSQQVNFISPQLQGLEVNDQDSLDYASHLLTTIKGLKKQVDQAFDPILKKAYEAHKEAVTQKKKFSAPLEEAEVSLKRKIGKFLEDHRKEQQVKEEVFAQPVETLPPLPSFLEIPTSISTRTNYTFTIEDKVLVPEEFKLVDLVKIGKLVRALGPQCNIPGIKVQIQTDIVSSSTSTKRNPPPLTE